MYFRVEPVTDGFNLNFYRDDEDIGEILVDGPYFFNYKSEAINFAEFFNESYGGD